MNSTTPATASAPVAPSAGAKKIGIVVVAYNAATTLEKVLDRIPPSFAEHLCEVLVCDDSSSDSTHLVSLGYQARSTLPITVIHHAKNLGYGGNQKSGYRYAIDNGWDIAVLLHGDGQYAPEVMPDIVEPLVSGRAEAVFGSRMMKAGSALSGGMPKYKYLGNRILTHIQNQLSGLELSEWHSGYRAYSLDALRQIDFETNSDQFDFDTEIILQLHNAGCRIVEVPIPTYYGDEICHVDGVRYGVDVIADTMQFVAERAGLGEGRLAQPPETYSLKDDPHSSHGILASWLGHRRQLDILDLGCGPGHLGAVFGGLGHRVTGVDVHVDDTARDRLGDVLTADLDNGIPDSIGDFDVIVMADLIEHVRDPGTLLADARNHLRDGGSVLVSVPNFGHWYPRLRTLVGRFDYDQRGILDSTHLRFFTLRSFRRMVERAGFDVARVDYTGVPFEQTDNPRPGHRTFQMFGALSRRMRPTLFAYQIVAELTPRAGRRSPEITRSAHSPGVS